MTIIVAGDRQVGLSRFSKLEPIRFIRREVGDSSLPAKDVNETNYLLWRERNREHLVWVNPHALWDPKDLRPHPGRHLFFEGSVTAPWKKWIAKHDLEVVDAQIPSDEKRMLFLLSGKTGMKFTKEAAQLLLDSFPGGYGALSWPVKALQLMEVPEPVSLEDASLVAWNGESVRLASQINRNLGKKKSLELAAMVNPQEAYGGLKYFEKSCAKRPERLEYLQFLLAGLEGGKWSAWIALQLFVHACYQDAKCQSPSRKRLSNSRTIPGAFQLYGIPSSRSFTTAANS